MLFPAVAHNPVSPALVRFDHSGLKNTILDAFPFYFAGCRLKFPVNQRTNQHDKRKTLGFVIILLVESVVIRFVLEVIVYMSFLRKLS